VLQERAQVHVFLDGRLLRTIPADMVERLAASAEATAHSRRTSASDSAVHPAAGGYCRSGCRPGCLRDFRSGRDASCVGVEIIERCVRRTTCNMPPTRMRIHARGPQARHGVQPLSVHIGGLSTARHWLRFVPVGHHRSRVSQSP
jgi:hypothetical protein